MGFFREKALTFIDGADKSSLAMKTVWFLLALLPGACVRTLSPFPQDVELHDLSSGELLEAAKAAKAKAVYGTWQTSINESAQSISFVRYRADAFSTEVLTAEGEHADSLSALCLEEGALAGINGSYFNVSERTSATYVKDDGKVTGVTQEGELFRTNGSVLSTRKEFVIDETEASTSWTGGDGWWEVMASGPILIDDGEVIEYEADADHPENFYRRRHPRSMIGMDSEGYVWLVTVDGRTPGSAEGMTIGELTLLARQLGLTDALNLDGGGSTTLWTKVDGVINHPCDNRRFDHTGQRKIPNAITVNGK